MKIEKRSEPLTTSTQPTELEDEIRRRAYELYETRGRENGHELEDWLQAKEEITRKARKVTAA